MRRCWRSGVSRHRVLLLWCGFFERRLGNPINFDLLIASVASRHQNYERAKEGKSEHEKAHEDVDLSLNPDQSHQKFRLKANLQTGVDGMRLVIVMTPGGHVPVVKVAVPQQQAHLLGQLASDAG